MKRFAVAALALPLLGCPYESKVPLGPSNEGQIDPALLGSWTCKGEDAKPLTLGIVAFDETQYVFDLHDKDGGGPLRAWSTEVAGGRLLNVQWLEDDAAKRTFSFARYSIDKEVLVLRLAEGELLKQVPETAPALREALAKDRPGLFQEFCRCQRVAEKK